MKKYSYGMLLPLFFLAFLYSALSATAQIKTGITIKGATTDSLTGKSLELVTITIKNSNAQALKTTISKNNGTFSFDQVLPGKYTITFINLGYVTKTISVSVADTSTQTSDIGKVLLREQANQLEDVAIVGEKPLIKQEIDRISYDIAADPESKGTNVLEMMRKVPMLSLDGENNIQLKGSANYKILINGKPSPMMDRSAKDILRSMPASSIKSIEVITDPPAKYDSDGLGGIINIITNKRLDNGYNATIFANASTPSGPGGGAFFSTKLGKFGATGGGNYAYYHIPRTSSLTTRNALTGSDKLLQSGIRDSYTNIWTPNGEMSYEIDSLNLIAVQLSYFGLIAKNNNTQNSMFSNNTGPLQGYGISTYSDIPQTGLNMAFNYQLGFKSNKNRILTFSYRNSSSRLDYLINVRISDRLNYSTPNYDQISNGNTLDQTFQLDYVHPLKKLNIEAGIKGIMRNNKSDFTYSAQNTSGIFVIDPSKSNNYRNNQDVFSAYNSYLYSLKDWGLRVGARIEETVVDADFISSSATVNQNYFNLIPSVLISRKFKNLSNMSLGFTQRIERPSITTLNPFVDRTNPNFEMAGNPALRPALSNNINLSFSRFKKLSLNTSISYAFANNAIQRISTFNSATNITSNTYANIGKNKTFAASLYLSYPFTKKLTATFNSTLSQVWFESIVDGILAKNRGIRGNLTSTLSYKFENGWRTNGGIYYTSPGIQLQGKTNSLFNNYVSVSKDLVKDKLTFFGTVSNPFVKYRTAHMEISGANFMQVNENRSYFRSFNATLSYKFGKLKEAIKKNKRGINNDDLASGGQ